MNAHTPGPWEAIDVRHDNDGDGMAFGIIAQRQPVAVMMNDIAAVWERGGKAKTNANARLIAAAPELLEALQWAMSQSSMTYAQRLKQNTEWCDAVDKARAAIAKATGSDK